MATMGNVLISCQDKYNMCVSVNILMMSITIVSLMLRSRKTMILSTVRKKEELILLITMNQYGLKNQNQTILTVSSIQLISWLVTFLFRSFYYSFGSTCALFLVPCSSH